MSKRTSQGAVKDRTTKSPTTWTQSIKSTIKSTDLKGCKHMQSELENLLHLTKEKIVQLETKAKRKGLNYEGEDEVECDCGNTFESGGDYGAFCDECEEKDAEEQCTDCIKECKADDCRKYLCTECRQTCSGCEDFFCPDCAYECDRCNEPFCDRNKDCALVGFGYCGQSACINCLER